MSKYTVIGIHPDEVATLGPDGASYVEWVRAVNPAGAAEVAKSLHEDREHSLVVAVMSGHHIDELFDAPSTGSKAARLASISRAGLGKRRVH